MSAAVALPSPREDALSWIDARSWMEGVNKHAQARFEGFDWCTVGASGVAHAVELVAHPDGSISYEPACRIGYYGTSQERVKPMSRPAVTCSRPGCRNAQVAVRRAAQAGTRPAQLELELTV